MNKLDEIKHKIALADILVGYSTVIFNNQTIYIKHFTFQEHLKVEQEYETSFEIAVKKGVPTIEDKIKELIKEKEWTDEEEKQFQKLPQDIGILKDTKKKFFLEKDVERIDKNIKAEEEKLQKLETKRNSLLGYTAETYATKKTNELFVFHTFRNQLELDKTLYSWEEFNELDESQMGDLINLFNKDCVRFAPQEMKKTAILNSHMQMIYLAGEDLWNFYGKPVVQFTARQSELYSLGRYFKGLISDLKDKVTSDVLDDPDKLIQYVDSQKAAETLGTAKIPEGKESIGGGTAIVGASTEDLKKLGLDKEKGADSLAEEAGKKGGSLNMEDLLKLHGLV